MTKFVKPWFDGPNHIQVLLFASSSNSMFALNLSLFLHIDYTISSSSHVDPST